MLYFALTDGWQTTFSSVFSSGPADATTSMLHSTAVQSAHKLLGDHLPPLQKPVAAFQSLNCHTPTVLSANTTPAACYCTLPCVLLSLYAVKHPYILKPGTAAGWMHSPWAGPNPSKTMAPYAFGAFLNHTYKKTKHISSFLF